MSTRTWDWTGWVDRKYWYPLLKPTKPIPEKPGVYMVCASKSIHRLNGVDENGILTIGESENLRSRLVDFVRCMRYGTTGHMAGWRFHQIGMHEKFPSDSLWVSWREVENKEAAYKKEGEMLEFYLRRYWELPPLNYKFNWAIRDADG